MGGVDTASWKLREALVALAEERLNAMTRRPEEKLIADLVTLEVECRFPALSDAFQTLLERFERDWGYRKSFAADKPRADGHPHQFGSCVRTSTGAGMERRTARRRRALGRGVSR